MRDKPTDVNNPYYGMGETDETKYAEDSGKCQETQDTKNTQKKKHPGGRPRVYAGGVPEMKSVSIDVDTFQYLKRLQGAISISKGKAVPVWEIIASLVHAGAGRKYPKECDLIRSCTGADEIQ